MNIKAVIPLVAGLGIAGLAAKLGLDYVKKAQGSQAKSVELWAVSADVPRGVAIEETMLAPMKFPAELVPRSALADKTSIIGRVPHTGVPAGLPVLDTMLLPAGVKAGVFVPPGYRAVAVKIDESSGVDNHLQPGCKVDVVGYFTIRGSSGKSETIARTIIENVEVAAVGQRLAVEAPTKTDPKDKKPAPSTKDKPARAATLLVKPEQVPILLLAEQKGEIKLSMRGLDDTDFVNRDDKVTEAAVTGAPTDPSKDSGIAGLIARLTRPQQEEPPPAAAPAEEPPQPTGPVFESTMVIYLGAEKKVLGWIAGKPTEPIELTAYEGNIFEQQEPRHRNPGDTRRKPRQEPGAPPADVPSEPVNPLPPEPEQQPKELIE